ncbi:MAG: LamG domain-containing protein [Planctomycetes bacterium]|nr:LamG domain-containing protein [Planctomycetota bacterium]
MNSVDRAIIGIVLILILCFPTLIYSNDEGVKSTEKDNSKQTADPVDVKKEQSRIKEEEKRSVDDSGADNAVKASTSDESSINRVLSLDGQEDYLRVVDSQSLRSFTNAITIEVWLKALSFYADNGIVNTIIRKNIANGLENFFLRFRNVDGSSVIQMSIGYDIEGLNVPYEFNKGTWYHIAGTYDGSSITVFINGLSIKSEQVSGSLYIDQSDLFIGKGDPEFSSGEYFHGELDEIRIWNIARPQEKIQAAMSTQLTGKEDGLVAYWNFDDGTAKDLSGKGNDGLLQGDAQIVESPRSTSQADQREQKNKLVAWWKFDEVNGDKVADSSGNRYQGKLIGNPQWKPASGKVNGALEFDGLGDFVEITNEPAFDLTGNITIAAWIKVNAFDKRWQAIVTKGDTSWRISRTAEENTLAFHCTGIESISSGWNNGIEGKKNVNDSQWHHAVGVYDGSTVFLYVDGVIDKSGKASGSIRMNDSPVFIGANSEKADREWNGLIDEVCIFRGAIDAKGIRALYSGENPMKVAQTANTQLQGPGKLVAWWKFENINNDSAGANHGTTNGNPTYVAGKVGQAISLDGDDYVDCGNPDLLNVGTGDWTISAWIKTTQSGTEPENRGTVFANGGDEAGGIRYTLAVNEEYLGTIVLTTDNDWQKVQAIGKTAVNDDKWHHVIGMRYAGQLRVYFDGVLDGTSYLSEGYDLSGASQHNAYIGVITDNRDDSLFKYFVGLIDEVCVFGGAVDANGVSALYSGEDPVTVAQTAIITGPVQKAVAKSQARPQQATGGGARGSIEGDWQIISSQVSQEAVIEIRRKPDGTLDAAIFAEDPDGASTSIPLDEITFENSKLYFEMMSKQRVFEGTMKEDGLTIEGQLRQQGKMIALVLKRVDAVPSEAAQTSQEKLQDRTTGTSGTSNIVTTLILILVLVGVVVLIIFFFVRASIR